MKINAADQTNNRHSRGGNRVPHPPKHPGKDSCKKFSRSEEAAALKGLKMKAAAQFSAANGQLPPGSPALGSHGLRTVRRPLSSNRANQTPTNMTPTNPNQNVTDHKASTPVSNTSYPANADELYLKHFPEVVVWAGRKGVRDPENFAQDTMLRALRGFDPARGKFEPRLASMRAFSYADEFRGRQNKLEAFPHNDEVFEVPFEDQPFNADLWKIVRDCLDQLRPLDRELILQRFWKGCSITEIMALPQYAAGGLSLRQHKVKAAYGRARACIRQSLTNPSSPTFADMDADGRLCQNPKRVRTSSPKVPPARKKNTRPTCVPQDI